MLSVIRRRFVPATDVADYRWRVLLCQRKKTEPRFKQDSKEGSEVLENDRSQMVASRKGRSRQLPSPKGERAFWNQAQKSVRSERLNGEVQWRTL